MPRKPLSAFATAAIACGLSIASSAALADYYASGACSGGRGAVYCNFSKKYVDPDAGVSKVITVKGPETPEETAASAARDRRWVERCRPALRQDRYGVSRYYYAAPNCDVGKTSD